MRVRSVVLAALAACCLALAGMAAPAGAARPKLCETSCGGSWGAKEHAKKYAEQHGFINVWVGGCERNGEYGAQWKCSGGGFHSGNEDWAVWMDAYGYEKHWVTFN